LDWDYPDVKAQLDTWLDHDSPAELARRYIEVFERELRRYPRTDFDLISSLAWSATSRHRDVDDAVLAWLELDPSIPRLAVAVNFLAALWEPHDDRLPPLDGERVLRLIRIGQGARRDLVVYGPWLDALARGALCSTDRIARRAVHAELVATEEDAPVLAQSFQHDIRALEE
jgi:hypothetical protein